MIAGFTNTPLFKNLIAIFLFLVLVAALVSIVVDHFLHIPDDPRIVNILTVGLGYCFSQLGNYQGANTITSTLSSIAQPGIQATQANTAATNENTSAIKGQPTK